MRSWKDVKEKHDKHDTFTLLYYAMVDVVDVGWSCAFLPLFMQKT